MGELNLPAKDDEYFYCTDFLHFFRSVFSVCTPTMLESWCSAAGVHKSVLIKIVNATSTSQLDIKFCDIYALFSKNPYVDAGLSLRFKPVQQWENFWAKDHSWYFNGPPATGDSSLAPES